MYHVRQLNQSSISILICMVAWLAAVLGSSHYEDPSISRLNWTESNGNIELNIQKLSSLLVSVQIIEGQYSLIKFEKVNPACCGEVIINQEVVSHHLWLWLEASRVPSRSRKLNWISSWERCIWVNNLRLYWGFLLNDTITLFSELLCVLLLILLEWLILLEKNLLQLNVAIVEHKSLSHELSKQAAINWLKLWVIFQILH